MHAHYAGTDVAMVPSLEEYEAQSVANGTKPGNRKIEAPANWVNN